MRKVIAAVLLTGGMLVACTLYVSEDATRNEPDVGPVESSGAPGSNDGHHGRRDAGVLDGGAPGDGPRPTGDGGAPGDGPRPTRDGGAPGDGPLGPPDDGPLGPPDDGPRPTGDGGYASSFPRSAASNSAR
jgi:hypothetical protein